MRRITQILQEMQADANGISCQRLDVALLGTALERASKHAVDEHCEDYGQLIAMLALAADAAPACRVTVMAAFATIAMLMLQEAKREADAAGPQGDDVPACEEMLKKAKDILKGGPDNAV